MTFTRASPQLGNYEGNLWTPDGGCVDNPFRWCDSLANNDPKVMTFMSRAFANQGHVRDQQHGVERHLHDHVRKPVDDSPRK